MKVTGTISYLALFGVSVLFDIDKAIATAGYRLNSPEKNHATSSRTQQHRELQNSLLPVTGHSASSFVNPNYSGYAFDVDPETRWESARTDQQWLYAELAQTYTVSRVVINWEAAFAADYQIQVSNDDRDPSSWTTVATVSNNNDSIDDITFSGTSARYVRMFATQRGTGWGYSIFDMEIYGDIGSGYVPPASVNLVGSSSTASASSSESSTFSADKAIDGNLDTRWSTNNSGNEWIYVNIGTKHLLFSVILEWHSNYADSYVIEVSDDAQTWFQRAQVSSGNDGQETITLPPDTVAQYVRISASSSRNNNGYSIKDIDIMGETSIQQDAPVATILSASASSVESQEPQNVPSLAIDGDFVNTRWSSQRTDNEWFEVQLDGVYSLNQVILYWESAYGLRYRIQTKVNPNDAWTTRATITNGQGGVETIDITGNSRDARFIRLQGDERGTQWGYSLFEFEVLGIGVSTDPAPTPPPTPQPTSASTIILPTVAAVASSIETQNNGNNVPDNVRDSRDDTRWASGRDNDEEWIYIDFGTERLLQFVELDWEAAYARSYQIQVSNNPSNFGNTVYSTTQGSGGVENISLPSNTRGRYLRVFCQLKQLPQYGYSLWKVEARGQ